MQILDPKTKREDLAQLIADTFNEPNQGTLFLLYCKKYPLRFVYRAFSEAKNVPAAQVRKSRAAIFIFLVKYYDNAQSTKSHPRP